MFQTNVPEPYKTENEPDLKEGVPEGLSDSASLRGERWTMEDRIDFAYAEKY